MKPVNNSHVEFCADHNVVTCRICEAGIYVPELYMQECVTKFFERHKDCSEVSLRNKLLAVLDAAIEADRIGFVSKLKPGSDQKLILQIQEHDGRFMGYVDSHESGMQYMIESFPFDVAEQLFGEQWADTEDNPHGIYKATSTEFDPECFYVGIAVDNMCAFRVLTMSEIRTLLVGAVSDIEEKRKSFVSNKN